MELQSLIVAKLKEALPDAEMKLVDFTGSGDHWELVIASESFRGKPRVRQHQMVYQPLRTLIDANSVHALKLTTLLPEQWQAGV